jgi:transglutaminase-like putative cysteine protease
MNKKVFTFIFILILVLGSSLTAFADSNVVKVDTENSTVSINYNTDNYSTIKVVVRKGFEQYVYNLTSFGETFPLQMGKGTYAVGVYEKVEGSKYKRIASETIEVNADENAVYLASVQNVKWDVESTTTQIAQTLTEGLETDQEKVEAIHQYIVENIVYDYEKANMVTSRYNPNVEDTMSSKKGICYDYSSVTAAMLRSLEIPTKLVKGDSNATNVYHAWNEVLIDGEWVVVDTTADAASWSMGVELSYEKDSSDYFADKVY